MSWKRVTGYVARGALFLAAVAIGALASSATADAPTPGFVPAQPGEKSYDLSNFVLQYPYQERTPEGTHEDPSRAGVRFDSSWATSEYPGPTDCVIILTDESGNEVGRSSLEWDSLQQVTTLPSFHDVPVSEEPSSASGSCAQGTYHPSDRGYEFSNVRAKRLANPTGHAGTAIEGRVQWRGGRAPLTRACVATLTFQDSSEQRIEFTLDAPSGRELRLLNLPDIPPDTIADVAISCTPFEGGS